MTNQQVINLFVSCNGRINGQGNNLSIRDCTLYSYDMPIAWQMRNDTSGKFYVTTVPSPSTTTSRHINMVKRAMANLKEAV